ncbi:MAG: hypothetical protein ABFD08_18960 [Syntrophomonas sp.]
MQRNIGKTLFGFKPRDVINEFERIDAEYQHKIETMQAEVNQARTDLKDAMEKQMELQKQLNGYIERERLVTDVMVTAQVNAQKLVEQAREKSRMMLENSEEELKHKLQELEFLRMKVTRFKEEFREVLDNYRVSLEKIKEVPDDVSFTPTLVTKDKIYEPGRRQDISS